MEMNNTEVTALFDQWNSALKTGDPKKVAECYSEEGILLPTVSNKVRHNHAEIEDYFVHFLAKGPQGEIDESNIRIYNDIAINSGIYTFSFSDGNKVQGRFTFVYRHEESGWKIIEHHSSVMPENY